ncbi:MAG TPA: TlpA disulfide reductase family protein [Steroidobacteraceae bacterium]|nr:TlpA disulfide reductase family protein [Steroidobacteraceae bacterium]
MKNATTIFIVGLLAGAAGFALYQHGNVPAPVADAHADTIAVAAKTSIVTTIPDVSLPNRAGEKQSLRAWPGKSMVINFWATWCAPCRKEIPLLKEVAKSEASSGFQVVGVAIDFRDDVIKYADNIKMDYPILIGEQEGLAAADAFGVNSAGLPFTVFTDEKGRIVTIYMGELTRAKVDTIFSNVKRVNHGELTPEAARGAIASKLQSLQKST